MEPLPSQAAAGEVSWHPLKLVYTNLYDKDGVFCYDVWVKRAKEEALCSQDVAAASSKTQKVGFQRLAPQP